MKQIPIFLALLLVGFHTVDTLAQSTDEMLVAKLERLLSAGDFKQLDGVLNEMTTAGLGEGEAEFQFLKGLCGVENRKWTEAKKSLQSYLATGDTVYRTEARKMLSAIPIERGGVIKNSLGMEFVRIPTGSFNMGSKYSYTNIQNLFSEVFANSPQKFSDEHPVHRVNITNDFYAGIHEVTIGQFGQFVADTGYQTDGERSGGSAGTFDPSSGQKADKTVTVAADWRNGNRDNPVSHVSWGDANAFVVWLGKKEGKKYRLPTEAEWEYFARAGTTTLFYSGDNVESLAGYANVPDQTMQENSGTPTSYAVLPSRDGYSGKAPVGSFKPNAFGLYDVHGNVFEWCYDGYTPNAYSVHNSTNPYIKADVDLRVIRGGCYM